MDTTITQRSEVEYELEITASAEDLAPEITKALRAQRARTTMKGFRPGKVPMSLVKKMYGQAIAYAVAEDYVQKTFEAEITDSGDYDVLGRPQLTELDVDLDKDLRAVVRFGVAPSFELADASGTKVYRLVNEVTDEDVEQEIDHLRRNHADLLPVEDEGAGDDDLVVVDMQQMEGGSPIIGQKEEDVEFFLNDDEVFDELRDAVRGKKAGDTARVTLEIDDEPASELLELPGQQQKGPKTYEVTVKEVKRLDLPEVDEEFVKEVTNDEHETPEALRTAIREELEKVWTRRSRELLESQLVDEALTLNPITVPESVVEFFLDSFVEDIKQRNDGKLPEGFDEAPFRAANRDQAEQQARWMLIHDKIVDEENLEVDEADIDAQLEEMYGGNEQAGVAQVRQLYEQMPRLMDQLRQQILSRKVFDVLVERFDVVEVDREGFEEVMKERRQHEHDHGHHHGHEHHEHAHPEPAAPAEDAAEEEPAP